MALPGSAMLIAGIGNPMVGAILLLGGMLNLRGDPYQHHGEQRHFMPRKAGQSAASSVRCQFWGYKSAERSGAEKSVCRTMGQFQCLETTVTQDYLCQK